jgi:hypothetical protein
MALSATEKTSILFWLGYSVFEDDGPAMRAIHSVDAHPQADPFVREILRKLGEIDRDIHNVRPLAMAIQDGSIHLRVHYTIDNLRRLGRQQVGRLSSFLKISIFSDVFSKGSGGDPATFYSGDPSEDRIDPRLGVPTRGG